MKKTEWVERSRPLGCLSKKKEISFNHCFFCTFSEGKNALWEKEERNLSEDLSRLSGGARGPPMNNAQGLRQRKRHFGVLGTKG